MSEHRSGVTYAVHKWSIEHPYFIIAVYTALLAMAGWALSGGMPRRMMPYVEQPLIGVVTMMPGLSAQEMELYVSKPIEEQLVNVKGLHYVRSSSQDGFSIVTLEFHYGTDLRKALFDVQALMNITQSFLPATGANLKPSWVLPIDPLNVPILSLSLSGQGWDPVKLREFADNTVVQRFKSLPQIYSVVPYGGYRRQLQVICDRDKLAAYGVSILDVRNTIDAYNAGRPGGTLTSGGHEQIIRVDSQAHDAATVAAYPLRSSTPGVATTGAGTAPMPAASAGGGGMGGMGGGAPPASGQPAPTSPAPAGFAQYPRTITIGDVARVEDTYWERRSAYHYVRHERGTPGEVRTDGLEVNVIADPDASSAKVVPRVLAEAKALEAEFPGVKLAVAYDNSRFVKILFGNLIHELVVAIILAAIAILFFLGEWRGTLIAVIVIPISLLLALLGIVPLGMSLNSGTLIGLLLAVGRVVDDTIIDIHSVERHLRLGKDPKTATIDGIGEVRLAVLASTFTILLALAPLLFSGGLTQMMFVELVWPLIMALLASTVVSFTLNALLCATLLRPEAERAADLRCAPWRWLHRFALEPFQRLLAWLEQRYAHAIDFLLEHRFLNLTRVLATVILGLVCYNFIGSEMMPLADVGQAFGAFEMEPGASFATTEAAVKRLEALVLEYPEIEQASIELGAESMFESFTPYYSGYSMPQVNGAMMMLTFSDKDSRRRDIWQVMDELQSRAMAEIPGLRRFQVKEMGSDVMASSLAPVSLILYGPDLRVLSRLGEEVVALGSAMPDVFQLASSWTLSKPTWEVKVDPRRAAQVGLTPAAIAEQAYYALRGGLTTEFLRTPNVRQNTILVRYAPDDRRTGADLENLYLNTPSGRSVQLKSVASVTLEPSPTLIEHDNLRRVISLNAYYRKGHKPSMDVTMDLMMAAMSKLNFPPGYGLEARGDMTQMMDSFRRLLVGLGLAVLFIFLVLVAQFRGITQPLQMVFSLPLELSGIFLALWLAQQAFSTVSILGVIVVTGMDITAAILLVDLIVQYRDRGVSRAVAVRTACPQRLRPILMTSIITAVVMLPLALFPRTGLDAYQPLGTTVIGGLTIGTLLTLFDIPIMHTLVDDLNRWFTEKVLRREYSWEKIGELTPEDEAFIAEFNEGSTTHHD